MILGPSAWLVLGGLGVTFVIAKKKAATAAVVIAPGLPGKGNTGIVPPTRVLS